MGPNAPKLGESCEIRWQAPGVRLYASPRPHRRPHFTGILTSVVKTVLLTFALLSCSLTMLGCDDFDSPAELKHNQIIAVQSTPASVALGETAELSLLLFDEEGAPISAPLATWSVEQPGAEPMGEISIAGDVVSYTAPATLIEAPAIVSIKLEVEVGDETLYATKFLPVGGPTLSNPVVTAITVNGEPQTSEVVLVAGSEVTLGIETEGALGSAPTFAWYARPGTIDEYRSAETTMVVPEAPGEGWLVVVVRDLPGIAFFSIPTRVE